MTFSKKIQYLLFATILIYIYIYITTNVYMNKYINICLKNEKFCYS